MLMEFIEALKEKFIASKDEREKWIGVYIGVVAVLLAICAMGGANATKDATRANIDAVNTWAFFQAKNLRRVNVGLMADGLELQLAAQPTLPEAVKTKYDDRIKAYREQAKQLASDKKTNEGLDELWEKGKALEKERDTALKRDPYFDWAQALLQIAIVLASVCLVTANIWLLAFSAGLAGLGALLMLNGYTMLLSIPFIG